MKMFPAAGINTDNLLSKETRSLCSKFEKLLLNSVTSNTWKKHSSAWNLLSKFFSDYNLELKLPLSIENARAFVTWAITVRKLQPSTVESYLSSIALAHELAGETCVKFSRDRCINLILKGGKNISLLEGEDRPTRLAMNIHLLRVLGHRLAAEKWDSLSKQVVWTAGVLSFYTSCRMGEILSANKMIFDDRTTLKWGDVKFLNDDEAIVFLPHTKNSGLHGAIVDIFPTNDYTCPMAALVQLKNLSISTKVYDSKKPVFMFSSGKFLTVKKMNEILEKILSDFTDEFHKISCHSFRAGMPSVIASYPDKSAVADLMEWGNWHSDSFERYTKHEREKKKTLFYKYVNLL